MRKSSGSYLLTHLEHPACFLTYSATASGSRLHLERPHMVLRQSPTAGRKYAFECLRAGLAYKELSHREHWHRNVLSVCAHAVT